MFSSLNLRAKDVHYRKSSILKRTRSPRLRVQHEALDFDHFRARRSQIGHPSLPAMVPTARRRRFGNLLAQGTRPSPTYGWAGTHMLTFIIFQDDRERIDHLGTAASFLIDED